MKSDEALTLQLLDAIAAEPIAIGPVQLSRAYLERIERVERLPSNQDGSDKSWVWEVLDEDRRHFERARDAGTRPLR